MRFALTTRRRWPLSPKITWLDIDLVDAVELLETLEKQANVKKRTPNPKLLDLVVAWIERTCGAQCSRSCAWVVWWSVYQRLETLRRKSIKYADVASTFHVNPFELTGDQLAGLHSNIARAKAQGMLASGKYDSHNWNAVYDLVLLATGDKEQAERAKTKALERYVNAKTGHK